MSIFLKGKTYYRTAEACRAAGISKNTFRRWVNQAMLTDVLTRDGRDWRLFTKEDVAALKAEVSCIERPWVRSTRSRRLENIGVQDDCLTEVMLTISGSIISGRPK